MSVEPKASVLIVDDRPSMTRTIALILGHKGYAVDVAQDGPTAIEKVRQAPFDAVLMDIKMPLMNGVEAHRRIKAIRPETVVIMMTAYALEDLVAEALQDGAYAVVYKPLDIERAIDLIEEAKRVRKGTLVMVVDDDPGICATLGHILRHKGYVVTIAHDGEAAIDLARERHYDATLIDVRLPTIDGLETYLAIYEVDPQAVVIMITGYHREVGDLVEAALQNHAFAYLRKPLDIDRLLALLEEIVH